MWQTYNGKGVTGCNYLGILQKKLEKFYHKRRLKIRLHYDNSL